VCVDDWHVVFSFFVVYYCLVSLAMGQIFLMCSCIYTIIIPIIILKTSLNNP
jgi:hypothetical protein